MAGLASRNIVLKYITLCQLCSSLWTSHRLDFEQEWVGLELGRVGLDFELEWVGLELGRMGLSFELEWVGLELGRVGLSFELE